MIPLCAQVTQIPVDRTRRITVEWTIERFLMLDVDGKWQARGRCRMWRYHVLASGVDVSTDALSDAFEIVTEAPTLEGVLRELFHAAWTQCLEGRGNDEAEH